MKSSAQEPTLRDIAKQLGISHTTVSRGLHNNPRISVSLRHQIHETAQRMGYRPNPMATALGQQRRTIRDSKVHSAIAWLNFWDDPAQLRRYREFNLYWQGAFEAAEQAGYRLEEFSCNRQIAAARLGNILQTRDIHGLLIPPHQHTPDDWGAFPWEDFSLVRFGYSMRYPPTHIVTSDQLSNSVLAFSRIRELGYQRIGFVAHQRTTTRFKAGFLMMQLESAPENRLPVLLLPSHPDRSLDARAFLAWMKKCRPDAILTDIAEMPNLLKNAGYRIPEDVGLAALSVLDGGADAGIYQNSEDIGRAAVELLISQIGHHHVGIPTVCRQVLIEGCWVDGSSLPPR